MSRGLRVSRNRPESAGSPSPHATPVLWNCSSVRFGPMWHAEQPAFLRKARARPARRARAPAGHPARIGRRVHPPTGSCGRSWRVLWRDPAPTVCARRRNETRRCKTPRVEGDPRPRRASGPSRECLGWAAGPAPPTCAAGGVGADGTEYRVSPPAGHRSGNERRPRAAPVYPAGVK